MTTSPLAALRRTSYYVRMSKHRDDVDQRDRLRLTQLSHGAG
ncbi:MAG TPA: hypothetical protein VK936_03905 [Longimicrobiales bacterium]|nr:hypothetical protein [Longimicrobiales bacterium]